MDDLQELNINLSFEQIKLTSKSSFKEIVKKQVKIKSFEYLIKLKENHSKAKNLQYTELNMQEYLKSGSNMTIRDKCFIFTARTRMLDLKANFKAGRNDISCEKCGNHDEDQQHLLSCPELNDNCVSLATSTIEYDHLFSNDIKKVEAIGKVLDVKFKQLKAEPNKTKCTGNDKSCAATTVSHNVDIVVDLD